MAIEIGVVNDKVGGDRRFDVNEMTKEFGMKEFVIPGRHT